MRKCGKDKEAILYRRQFLTAALPLALASRRAEAAVRPNVLFIVADDMNTSLGCFGQSAVRTPNIDGLARRGTLFEHAYCQYPLCQPSRTSFLSGRRPETTKVYTLQTPTRKHLGDTVFLPEYFRKQGYYTAHAGKVYHTGGDEFEDPRSWDEEFRERGKKPPRETVLRAGKEPGPEGPLVRVGHSEVHHEQTQKGRSSQDRGIDGEGRPRAPAFFLGCGFRAARAVRRPAGQKYFDMYPPDRIELPAGNSADYARLLPAAINHEAPDQPLAPRVVRRLTFFFFSPLSLSAGSRA